MRRSPPASIFRGFGATSIVTYEISEWQNIWYVHNIFLDGMTNDGLVLGNWGADQRNFGDGVGARRQMLRVGWEPPFGGYLEERVRTLVNQTYYGGDFARYSPGTGAFPYHHYYDFSVRYSRPWKDLTVGGEVLGGRDVFGKSFSQDCPDSCATAAMSARATTAPLDEDSYSGGPEANTERKLFVDAGMNVNQVRTISAEPIIPITTSNLGVRSAFRRGRAPRGLREQRSGRTRRSGSSRRPFADRRARPRLSISIHRALCARSVRRRRPLQRGDAGVFASTSELGALWRNVLPKWDLGIDLRYAQNVARDHILASDPQGPRPDSFYKIETGTVVFVPKILEDEAGLIHRTPAAVALTINYSSHPCA